MPVTGRKPKDGPVRHRVKPVHDWTEVPNLAFEDGPPLPRSPQRPPALVAPEPAYPLGVNGRELWNRAWSTATTPPDGDQLVQLCQQVDERAALYFVVLRDGDWRDRNALRALDAQITAGLVRLSDRQDVTRPATWPAATRRWWTAVSRLPHCVAWTDADWQFARDTAHIVAAFHAGNLSVAQEIRRRERIMGTTADARRDLRIRYVDPLEPEVTTNPSVTAMADYRRSVQA